MGNILIQFFDAVMKIHWSIKIFIVYLIFFPVLINAFSPRYIDTDFWQKTKKGANLFNQKVTRENIRTAKSYGIQFLRLAPDKFISRKRDFLLGSADNYEGIVKEDLKQLISVLDICAEENMPVVLTMLSFPGSRWKQNNDEIDDFRLWIDNKFQTQAIQFWHDLALELKDHPAIIGYNPLNEPCPEKIINMKVSAVQELIFKFYSKVVDSIRKVDQLTPIILDCTDHANSQTFSYFKPQEKDNIIYSFHMYEPYSYTCRKINQERFSYPGSIDNKFWDKAELKKHLQAVIDFQRKHNIANNRILVGEFGADRLSPGLTHYLQDLIDIFNENRWHHAFYAFREDT